MNTIELNKVRKTYDHFVAVDDLSFNIEQGAVFGLLGPNGAGKTSTIRMMIAITSPNSAPTNVFDRPFNRHPPHGPGRETLRRHLPDQPRQACAGGQSQRRESALRQEQRAN